MADVITIIAELLKITPNLIDKYTQQGPIYGAFFLIFFPTLFLLIFVYLIGKRFIKHPAFGILISVAVYAFIVLQGFYSWFVILAEYWIFLLIFLGVFYFLFKRNEGGGGGQVGKRGIVENILGQVGTRYAKKLTGQERDLVNRIKANLEIFKKLKPGDRELVQIMSNLQTDIAMLRDMTSVAGTKVQSEYGPIMREYEKIAKEKKMST